MDKTITYKPYGNNAILVEWQSKIDESILKDIIHFKTKILTSTDKIQDIIVAYNSLTIIYKLSICDFHEEVKNLKKIYLNKAKELKFRGDIWEIPVCYDLEFGLDLEEISHKKELSISKIIELHTQPLYTVFFIGFLPGFPYLCGLSEQLFFERKANPRLKVEKGSVAIGGQQTGVYPVNSSGGWNIIGKSPINFFDNSRLEPTFLKSGDKIKFVPISKELFLKIDRKVRSKVYSITKINKND